MISANARENLEIKARCPDPTVLRAAVVRVAGAPAELLEQTDTYFAVPAGRLKLREINGVRAELIYYERPDDPAVRLSRYHLVDVRDPAGLKATLSAALGVVAIVRKRRELFLWHNVRIHLDAVENLGSFIELEAVLSSTAGEAESRARLDELTRVLDVRPEHHLAGSYAELVVRSSVK